MGGGHCALTLRHMQGCRVRRASKALGLGRGKGCVPCCRRGPRSWSPRILELVLSEAGGDTGWAMSPEVPVPKHADFRPMRECTCRRKALSSYELVTVSMVLGGWLPQLPALSQLPQTRAGCGPLEPHAGPVWPFAHVGTGRASTVC